MRNITEEAIVILAEECAEVIQEVSKCQRFGIEGDNRKRLIVEISQLEAMIGIAYKVLDLSGEELSDSFDAYVGKKEKLRQYSTFLKHLEKL